MLWRWINCSLHMQEFVCLGCYTGKTWLCWKIGKSLKMEEKAKSFTWAALMDSLDPLTKPAVVWSRTQRRRSLSCIQTKNSSRKTTEEQSDTLSIYARELGTLIKAWVTGGFSKAHLSGKRGTWGYKEFHSSISIWCNLTLNQLLYSLFHKYDT